MPRNFVYLVVGALAIAVASAGIYGISTIRLTQASPDPAQPDYSSQLNSLNTQVTSISSQVVSLRSQLDTMSSEVDSINSNLTSLGMIKNNLSDIHEKLADLQNLNTNVADIQNKLSNIANATSQTAAPSQQIVIVLDKTAYLPGDTVHINAAGAVPLKVVEVQLLDSNGYVLEGETTWADSAGTVLYALQLSSVILPGEYQIKLSSGSETAMQPITIVSSSGTASNSYTFTAQTDKTSYQQGDIIQVTGVALPSSTVTAVLQGPGGTSFTSSTTANSDGSYTLIFASSQSYETGSWTVTVTNLSQSKSLLIVIDQAGVQASSGTFTAQADRSAYYLGDTIQISGTAQPDSSVTAVFTNPSQDTYSASATATSSGTYTILFSTASSFQTGSWSVVVSNLGQSDTISFTLSSSTSGSYAFTAQTDQSTYAQGDLVQVAGSAQPGSSVSATMVSPSGTTYNSSSMANSSGSYVLFFSTTASYPTGNWYIEASNQGQTKILSFNLQQAP